MNELSWGERQRLAIASVVITTPGILVLDEPFSGVDHKAAADLIGTLRTLNRDTGMTVIIAEHRIGIVMALATRVVVLSEGKIVSDTKQADGESTGNTRFVPAKMNFPSACRRICRDQPEEPGKCSDNLARGHLVQVPRRQVIRP